MTQKSYNIQKIDLSHIDDVVNFLNEIKADFNMRIDRNITIDSYANKILQSAYCVAVYIDSKLEGLLATYCNDLTGRRAFVTIFGVGVQYRKHGIGRMLMEHTISHLKEINMRTVALVTANLRAREFYKLLGFLDTREEINSHGERLYHLEKDI